MSLCARLPWLVAQREEQLLFYSWPVAPEAIAGRLPPGLVLEGFEDRAWVTLIPFQMRGLRLRGTPPIPGLSAFGEVDCLTYVRPAGGGPSGIWFFRIAAATSMGSWMARWLWGLPYHSMPVAVRAAAGGTRCLAGPPGAPALDIRYRGTGPVFEASPGTLAHFVAERFVMYSVTRGGTLLSGREARPPRPIQAAEVEVAVNRIPAMAGLPEPGAGTVSWTCAESSLRTWLPAPVDVTTTPAR